MTLSMREQLIQEIQKMSDDDIASLMGWLREMESSETPPFNSTKDIATSPSDRSAGLSAQVKDVINEDTERRGSWTLKDSE
jgi:hypothetical protein